MASRTSSRRRRPTSSGAPDPLVCPRPVAHQGLRTGVEKGDTQRVLDGDLDDFIEASLKQGV